MASTTKTVHIIPKADFTTSGGVINRDIFRQELIAAGLTVPPEDVKEVATDVQITLAGLAVAADLSAMDGVAASHGAAEFAPTTQREVHNPVVNASDATEVEIVRLESGPLREGSYDLSWYCEHLAANAGAVSQVKVYASINGGSEVELGQDSSSLQVHDAFSGSFPTPPIKDGDRVVIRMTVARISGTGIASARRSRIFLKRDIQ